MGYIEQRHSKRIPVNLHAKIRSGNRSYEGYITNVSEHGIGYLVTSLSMTAGGFAPEKTYEAGHLIASLNLISEDFAPEKIIELSFHIPSGEQVDIQCGVGWFSWDASKGEAAMGMRIIDSSSAYLQFIKDMEGGVEGLTP